MEQDETNNNEDLDRLEIAKQKIGGRKEFYEFARILKEWVDESEDCCRKTIDTVMYDLLEDLEIDMRRGGTMPDGSSQETVTWLYLAELFHTLMLENT